MDNNELAFETVLITGGAGYVGSELTMALLSKGIKVKVFDILYYGDDHLPKDDPNLTMIAGDIRDTDLLRESLAGVDAVIHLACISNDPSFELDSDLSKSINFDCFEPMVVAAKEAGVRRFIYASTSSVYGVSESPTVDENHPLIPLTDYNRFKGMCEPLLFKHQTDDFVCVTIRPATVCGYSKRTRLDLTVNILTNHAVRNGKIMVFGGEQYRPNIHIKDMVRLYEMLLELPGDRIAGETFNAGWRNLSVMEIAETVKRVVEEELPNRAPIEIERTPSDDKRSYRVTSTKIAERLGFVPEFGVEDAVRDLVRAFDAGLLPDSLENDWYFNVKLMKGMGVS